MRSTFIAAVALVAIALPSAALPDLAVSGPLVFDAAPKGPHGSMDFLGPTQAVYVTGTVKNLGSARSTGTMVELVINDRVIGRQLLTEIKPGAEAPFSIKWIPDGEGPCDVTVKVDPSNSMREDDKANNVAKANLKIKYNVPTSSTTGENVPRPDLQVRGMSISPDPLSGRLSIISCELYNAGDAVADTTDLVLMMDGSRFTTKQLGPLAPETPMTVIISWTPARRGSKNIQVVVDPMNVVMESDESNNKLEKTVEVKR